MNSTGFANLQVPTAQPQAAKANPAMGVRRMCASPTGRFLATVNEAQRCALWLWDLQDLALVCLLQHQQPVASFEWDPLHDKLAVCTSGRRCAPRLPACVGGATFYPFDM